jgi:hypothetical protein
MEKPLMPKAVAVWLIENTSLSFDQIAEFCGLHLLEVQGIADGEVAVGIIGQDPTITKELTVDEIKRCEIDPKAKLRISKFESYAPKKKVAKYTPIARRQDKPDAVNWLLRNCPSMTDSQIIKLIGTTKTTIDSIRNRTHWNINQIKPRDPVLLGLCTQASLNLYLEKENSKLEETN